MNAFWNFKRYIDEHGVTPMLVIRICAITLNLFLALCLIFGWLIPAVTPPSEPLPIFGPDGIQLIDEMGRPMFTDPANAPDMNFFDVVFFVPTLGVFLAWSSRKGFQLASVGALAITILYMVTKWL